MPIQTFYFYKNTQTGDFTNEATARANPDIHQRHTITIEAMTSVIAAEEATTEESGDAPTP